MSCQKCGHHEMLGPTYDPMFVPCGMNGTYRTEALVYRCPKYGYFEGRDCADKKSGREAVEEYITKAMNQPLDAARKNR
jgi:hypothetical protein